MSDVEESGGEIICPYCKHEHIDSWECGLDNDGDSMEYECDECSKKFHVSLCIDTTFNTNGLCKENSEDHNWKHFDHEKTDGEGICKGKRCLTCGEYEFDKFKEANK